MYNSCYSFMQQAHIPICSAINYIKIITTLIKSNKMNLHSAAKPFRLWWRLWLLYYIFSLNQSNQFYFFTTVKYFSFIFFFLLPPRVSGFFLIALIIHKLKKNCNNRKQLSTWNETCVHLHTTVKFFAPLILKLSTSLSFC